MAKTSNPHINNLEASQRAALDRAVAARKKLSAARREHGLSDDLAFFTVAEHDAEISALQREHDAEIQGIVMNFMVNTNKYARLAKLAIANSKRAMTPQEIAQRDWLATVAAATEIVAKRDRETASRATADAIIRAGRRRRSEEG